MQKKPSKQSPKPTPAFPTAGSEEYMMQPDAMPIRVLRLLASVGTATFRPKCRPMNSLRCFSTCPAIKVSRLPVRFQGIIADIFIFVGARTYTYTTRPRHRRPPQQQTNEGMSYLTVLFPLLLLTLLAFFSNMRKETPLYQLEPSKDYPIQRQTSRHGLPYFVNNDFAKVLNSTLLSNNKPLTPLPLPQVNIKDKEAVDEMVEHKMIRLLRENCLAERQYLNRLKSR